MIYLGNLFFLVIKYMYMYICNVMRSEFWGDIGNMKYVLLGNNRCIER